MSFFDNFPLFYETGIHASPNRLQKRFEAIIEKNKEIIKNSTILDLASHDGRWSFAALKMGANYVCGIEGRKSLIQKSHEAMKKYGIPNEKYSFIPGDINTEIKKIESQKFDVVFCLGFFYHTMKHEFLLSEIKRISPKYLILDSIINPNNLPIIKLVLEDYSVGGDPVQGLETRNNKIIAGRPSRKAIELMLNFFEFNFEYYDWLNAGIDNWEGLQDYKKGNHVTILAKNLNC